MVAMNGAASGTAVNKARLSPGRQWIGIANLIRDDRLQPRHGKPDFDWVHDLSDFRKDGSEFPPIRVYQMADGSLYAAEGFHRIPAMEMAGEDSILCDVVDGTFEEAIVYAAGSNRSNGVRPMGPKDITKAVEMLLQIDEWWSKSANLIATHIGCSSQKVGRIRQRIAARENRQIPQATVNSKGVAKKTSHGSRRSHHEKPLVIPPITIARHGKPSKYETKFENKTVRGKTPGEVEEKIRRLHNESMARKLSLKCGGSTLLQDCGFLGIGVGPGYPGMSGYHMTGIVALGCQFATTDELPAVIGRLVAARRYLISQDYNFGPYIQVNVTGQYRMVVLCYPEDGPAKMLDLYRAEGFEFLTPEELEASLKAGGGS